MNVTAKLPVRSLLTVVALFAAVACGALAAAPLPRAPGVLVGSFVVAGAGLGLAVLLIRRVDRRPASDLGLGPRNAVRGSLLGLAVVAAAVAAGTVLAAACGLTEPPTVGRTSGTAVLLLLVQAFVLQGFPEEVLFRGYLVQTAVGRLPGWGVITLSTLLFGVLHLASSSGAQTIVQRLLFLLIPIGFALTATVVRLATGSVWPAVVVHGGFHVSSYVAGLWVAPSPEAYGAYLALVGGAQVVAGALLLAGWKLSRKVRHTLSGFSPTMAV